MNKNKNFSVAVSISLERADFSANPFDKTNMPTIQVVLKATENSNGVEFLKGEIALEPQPASSVKIMNKALELAVEYLRDAIGNAEHVIKSEPRHRDVR